MERLDVADGIIKVIEVGEETVNITTKIWIGEEETSINLNEEELQELIDALTSIKKQITGEEKKHSLPPL